MALIPMHTFYNLPTPCVYIMYLEPNKYKFGETIWLHEQAKRSRCNHKSAHVVWAQATGEPRASHLAVEHVRRELHGSKKQFTCSIEDVGVFKKWFVDNPAHAIDDARLQTYVQQNLQKAP